MRPRSSTRDDTAPEDADQGTTSASDLVELECAGVSVSCRGFVALLVRKGIGHAISKPPYSVQLMRGAAPASELPPDLSKEYVLPVADTSGGVDETNAATSARAQTMLQLLQNPPCDMGIQLPYTALGEVTKSADAVLGALYSSAIRSIGGQVVAIDSHAAFIAGAYPLGGNGGCWASGMQSKNTACPLAARRSVLGRS